MEWRSNSKHSSYKSIDKSSIVLGAPTTLLREAYYFNKKFCVATQPEQLTLKVIHLKERII